MTEDKFQFLEAGETSITRAWLSAQSKTLHTALSNHPARALIEQLATDILSAPAMDTPLSAGGRYVFSYRPVDQTLPYCCWRMGQNGHLSVLASPTEQYGRNHTPFPLSISTDGHRAAIGWRTDCRDEWEMQIMELQSGRVLATALPPFESQRTVLDSNLRGYWYVRAVAGSIQLMYQSIDDPAADPVLIQSTLPAEKSTDVSVLRFPESDWLVLAIRVPELRCAFDYYLLSRNPESPLRVLWKEWPYKTSFCASGDRLFILTDWESPNMRVLHQDLADFAQNNAAVLIPEGARAITAMHLAGETILLRVAATPWTTELQAFSNDGKPLEVVGLPVDGTIEVVRAVAGKKSAFIEESGMGRRPSLHLLDTQTGKATPYFQSISRVSLPEIETVTSWYKSFDGTRVPVRVSRRKDLTTRGPSPAMLTTYGGFGVTDTLRYTNRSALWLSLGGVYVHAGVRGGGELGAEWHRAGMLHQKPNTFSDFIAAAEWLVAQGYTTTDKLAIVGGSNAGLVVAVAMTMRPDLFGAVVCSGPLLDMLRFHMFAGGSVGLPEFGSPDNPIDAEVLRSYSPYHNIQVGVDYPPVLFISGDADTRCDPMHVRKMVARMRDANPSGQNVLMDYRPNKGHSGLMPLSDRIDTLTNQFVFLLHALGLHVNEHGQFACYRKEVMTPP